MRAIPIRPVDVEIAALLHRESQFPEVWDATAFADLLAMPSAHGRFAAIGKDDPPAGLVLWRVAADEAEILTIGVLPAKRRRGIGQFLLENAFADMQALGVKRVYLEVAADNPAAAALYRKLGFRTEGMRPGYYRMPQGPVDAAIVVKTLS